MRVYRNAVMDNARWTGFEPRPDDIFVCTPSKCGTTWMQTIVANLLWPDGDIPGQIVNGISPWIEAKFIPADAMHAMLKAQTHRRAMKSHSPADAIPWFPQAKYITVARDGRDAFMSWCNHVERMKMIDMLNAAGRKGRLAADEEVHRRLPRASSRTGSTRTTSSTSSRVIGHAATNRTCCSCTTTT